MYNGRGALPASIVYILSPGSTVYLWAPEGQLEGMRGGILHLLSLLENKVYASILNLKFICEVL